MSDTALRRILYVDDDDDLRSIAVFALEALGGFEVAACASGAEALARVAEFQPQLLLLDVMMPEMDGPAVLRALRGLPVTAATPAVFMTAATRPEEVAGFVAGGAIDVIAKPFDPMTLPETVRMAWSRRDG